MTIFRFAPLFRAPRPEQKQEDIDDAYAAGYDEAHGEIHEERALSFTDANGRRAVYHLRCGRKLGLGRFCLRRAQHPEDQCDPRWEFNQ